MPGTTFYLRTGQWPDSTLSLLDWFVFAHSDLIKWTIFGLHLKSAKCDPQLRNLLFPMFNPWLILAWNGRKGILRSFVHVWFQPYLGIWLLARKGSWTHGSHPKLLYTFPFVLCRSNATLDLHRWSPTIEKHKGLKAQPRLNDHFFFLRN